MKRRGSPVPRQIGNDQSAILAEFAEAAAELLGGAEESMTEDERLALPADKISKGLAADLDEPLVHHRQVSARFGRDLGAQVHVKTGRHASMEALKTLGGDVRGPLAYRRQNSFATVTAAGSTIDR
jgi:hypothetical protein